MEEWRTIPGFTNYEVSSSGRVRSWVTPRRGSSSIRRTEPLVKRLSTDKAGRKFVTLSNGIVVKNALVHGLVMQAFVGERPTGCHVCHYNGDPSDNRLENLRYDTPAGNYADMVRHGRNAVGSRQGNAVLNESIVATLHWAAGLGIPGRRIARAFGMNCSTVAAAVRGQNWKHVAG